MTRIFPRDLICVAADGRYHYAVVLDRIRYFGGNWCYVFHRTSDAPLDPAEVLGGPADGFHAFVDFIHAKRDGRLTRVATKIDTTPFRGGGFLKQTTTVQGHAARWWIYDMENVEVRVVAALSDEERRYPLRETIDDVVMVERVGQQWRPEADPRI